MSGKSYQYLLEFNDHASVKMRGLSAEAGILDRKTRAVGQEMSRTAYQSRVMGNEFSRTQTKSSMLSGAFGMLRGQVIAFVAATALLSGTGHLSKAASGFEQTSIAFETMLGSAEKSKKTIRDLNDFSNVTPFTNDQVFKASKSLLAYNIQAEELIPTLTSLGNISAGVGVEKLPQLILAFGQVKAATRLTGMELRQFTEAGVPLLDELSKVTGKTVATIKEDLIPGGKIGFDTVRVAMANMSKEGGKFFNLMDRQSATFGGRISTLQGKVGLLSVAYGDSLNRFFKPAIENMIGMTDSLLENTKSLEDRYISQSKKVQALSADTLPLVRRYQELSGMTVLNRDQQSELKTILTELANDIPSAVTAWDAYGNAISVSTEKIKDFIKYNTDAKELLNEESIGSKQGEYQTYQKRAQEIQQLLGGGIKYDSSGRGYSLTGRTDLLGNAVTESWDSQKIAAVRKELNAIIGSDGLLQNIYNDINDLRGKGKLTASQLARENITGPVMPSLGGLFDQPLLDTDSGNSTNALNQETANGIEGITAGGTKNVSINFQGGIKFAENIDISVEQLQDGLDQLEPQMREFFVRLLSGGLHTATGQ